MGIEGQLTSTPEEDNSNNVLDLSKMTVDEWASTSNTGQWIATGLVAFPRPGLNFQQSSNNLSYTRIVIFNTQTNIKWNVLEKWAEINLGFPFPEPLDWSEDDKFFYLTNSVAPDGCSAFNYLSGLVRVNLEDGIIADLLPTGSSIWVALSPDQSLVAYIGVGGRGLVFQDLETGAEKEVDIDPGKDYQAGHVLWSPNGKLVALTLVINPCGDINESYSTILLVDSRTLNMRVLLQEDPRLLIAKDWTDSATITLVDGIYADASLEEIPFSSRWKIDINSGEIKSEEQ